MSFIHAYNIYIYIDFHVLVLKVVIIYLEPSLVIVLKESKCMCMSDFVINP